MKDLSQLRYYDILFLKSGNNEQDSKVCYLILSFLPTKRTFRKIGEILFTGKYIARLFISNFPGRVYFMPSFWFVCNPCTPYMNTVAFFWKYYCAFSLIWWNSYQNEILVLEVLNKNLVSNPLPILNSLLRTVNWLVLLFFTGYTLTNNAY